MRSSTKKKRYKTLKINQTEISELMNTMNELKHSIKSFDSRPNQEPEVFRRHPHNQYVHGLMLSLTNHQGNQVKPR